MARRVVLIVPIMFMCVGVPAQGARPALSDPTVQTPSASPLSRKGPLLLVRTDPLCDGDLRS